MVVVFLGRRNVHQFTYVNLVPNTLNNVKGYTTFRVKKSLWYLQRNLWLFFSFRVTIEKDTSTIVQCKSKSQTPLNDFMKEISRVDEDSLETPVYF